MITRYSKKSGDISTEFDRLIDKETYLVEGAMPVKETMGEENIPRKVCCVCNHELKGLKPFEHQATSFVQCPQCEHIQTRLMLGPKAQKAFEKHLSYSEIYPKLDVAQFMKRRDAVYKPKLDFLIDVLLQKGFSQDQIQTKQWLEIGSGAGYMLSALEEYGVENIKGYDRDQNLVDVNQGMLSKAKLSHSMLRMEETIEQNSFDILMSIFVLEHINDLVPVQKALQKQNAGSVFYFSVPVLGFATALEAVVDDHAGRNLDGLVHQQLFTEKSIESFLTGAGYEQVGEWVFGQDAMDLARFFLVRLAGKYPANIAQEMVEKLNALIDPLQGVIDQAHMADARHIVAIKK